jgi:hypothetical protein
MGSSLRKYSLKYIPMGQYKFTISLSWQFGFLVRYVPGVFITIDLPIIGGYIGLTDTASGFHFESELFNGKYN